MKSKILTYAIGALIALFIGNQVYNTIKINNLKGKVNEVYNQQIDSLKNQVQELQLSNDSIKIRVVESNKIIDSLLVYSAQLENKRTTNTRYYEQKINSVNTTPIDSLRKFLTEYNYSKQ